VSDVDVARRFANAARLVSESDDHEQAAARVVKLANELVGCSWAALIGRARHDGSVDVLADDGDEPVSRVLHTLQSSRQGPARQVLADHTTVVSNDLAADHRWPKYASSVVRHTPVRSALGLSLQLADDHLGVLMLYSEHVGFFTENRIEQASVYADHVAIALTVLRAQNKVENLRIALDTNREIAIAMGILMSRRGITSDQAFEILRTHSQHHHRKLHEIAEEVALTGDMPES
jgi:GAF domain-containing protein